MIDKGGKVLSALRFKHLSLVLSRVSDINLLFSLIENVRKSLDPVHNIQTLELRVSSGGGLGFRITAASENKTLILLLHLSVAVKAQEFEDSKISALHPPPKKSK